MGVCGKGELVPFSPALKNRFWILSLNSLQKTTDLVLHSKIKDPEKQALTVLTVPIMSLFWGQINVILCILFPIFNNLSFIQEELPSVEATDDSSLNDNAVLHEEINGELMFEFHDDDRRKKLNYRTRERLYNRPLYNETSP